MRGALGRVTRSPTDKRDIRLRAIVDRSSFQPPPIRDWSPPTDLPWLCNDAIGCCTITGLGHLMQIQALQRGESVDFTDSDIVDAYSATTGYVRGQPDTDRGGLMISALKHARDVGIGGRRIGAFARVNHSDQLEMQTAINFFGGVYVGAELPISAEQEKELWWVPPTPTPDDAPGSLGGHAFVLCGYDHVSWRGRPWRDSRVITTAWAERCIDEAWVILDEEWVTDVKPAPVGLDVATLRVLLSRLEG